MRFGTLLALVLVAGMCSAQKRLVLIDQDGAGPGGSDQMAMLALLQAPDVQVLGITIVTGDAWRDEETLHTLRMLELSGHSDVLLHSFFIATLVVFGMIHAVSCRSRLSRTAFHST